MKKKYSIKEDFSMLALLIIPIGIALNVIGDQLVSILKLPVYLDTLGSVLTGVLAGPWVGALTGVLTNIITGIIRNPTLIPYAITNGLVGFVAGLFSRAGWFKLEGTKGWIRTIVAIFVLCICTIGTSAPISVFMYGGISGNGGSSLVIAGLLASGQSIWATVIGVDGLATVMDRIITHVVVMLIVKVIPDRTKIKFSCGEQYAKAID